MNFGANIIVIDCEMTGPDVESNQLVEIAAIKCDPRNLKVIDTFHMHIGKEEELSVEEIAQRAHPEAMAKVGLDLYADRFRLLPSPRSVIRRFYSWLPTKYILCGYSIALDMAFISSAMRRANINHRFGIRQIDLYGLAELYYGVSGTPFAHRTLASVAADLGIEASNSHVAKQDCMAAYRVFLRLLQKISFD